MQSNSDNSSVAAAMMAALVTRRPAANEAASQNAMRVYLDKLRELVPHCPKNRNVSKLELIQHVIDYINDLQETLQSGGEDGDSPPSSPLANPLSFTEAFSHLSFSEDGNLRGIKPGSSYEDPPAACNAATAYTSDGSSDYDSRGSSPINNSDTDYSSDEYTSTQYSQQYAGPFYSNSLSLQVAPPLAPPQTFNSPATPSSSDPRRFYRKGYGLPAHLSG
ncbi:UNVERIFIED_CONTAM: hypothetical protein GTU68_018152 [Idotea baltica]|nr:hypothetical protein [Idotea baltica]